MAPKIVRNSRTFCELERAFLADIHANPSDDLPRLAYADWLDESGDPPQAEFIRLQCETAKKWGGPWASCEYTPRERSLLRRHGRRWRGQRLLPDGKLHCYPSEMSFEYDGWEALTFVRFYRGLPDVCLSAWNDHGVSDMDAVAEAIPHHFQLSLIYNIFPGHYRRDEGGDPNYFLHHPVTARAYRVELLGIGQDHEPVVLPDELVAAAVEKFLTTNVMYVRFNKLSETGVKLIGPLWPRIVPMWS